MDALTMHSRVLVRDLNSGIESSYTLVFPQDADIARSKISILVPIATVLLGYRGGDEIEWPTPGGRRRLKIVKVLYQPEAAGDEPEHSVALYRQSRERNELTNLKSRLNEQEKVAYGRELPGEALISTTAEGEMK
jgi:Transcription elongation factor, GreA/GreB, C-term